METVRLDPECIRCIMSKKLDDYPKDVSVERQVEYLQRIMRVAADTPRSFGAPIISRDIHRIQREMFGIVEDYSEIKRHFNSIMLSREAEVAEQLAAASDPLRLAVQYTLTGNYIDFGAMDSVDESKLSELLAQSGAIPLPETAYLALRADILAARSLVYLTDNCGEIVLDKLLIQVIRRLNERLAVTVLVRGAPTINDATIEDAEQVGLPEVAEVLGNGSDIAATCLEDISPEALRLLNTADVVIAKGQGNFEAMRRCGLNVYYLFLCKCRMFADRFGVPRLHSMLMHDSEA